MPPLSALFAQYWLHNNQEMLLYQPRVFPQYATPAQNPESLRSPSEHNLPFDNVYLDTADSERLHCWCAAPPLSPYPLDQQ